MAGNKYNSTIRTKILNDFSKGLSRKEISVKYLWCSILILKKSQIVFVTIKQKD